MHPSLSLPNKYEIFVSFHDQVCSLEREWDKNGCFLKLYICIDIDKENLVGNKSSGLSRIQIVEVLCFDICLPI